MAAETFRIEIPINVQDNTEPGVGNATRKMNGFDKANQKTQERLDQMNRTKYQVVIDALDKAGSVIDRVWSGAKKLGGKVFTVTFKAIDMVTRPIRSIISGIMSPIGTMIGVAGGIGMASLVSGFVESAGRADTLNVAMNAVAKSTGTSIEALNEHKKAVMDLGIAEQEATQVMTRFMQSELDTAEAAKIARIAQDAAVIANTNSSEATETMVEAVAKLRPELLAQFGMTKNLNDIYNDYADQVGIVVRTKNKYGKEVRHLTRELTEQEKKQAMLNYIMEEGTKIAGTYEDAMDSPFKKMGSLTRYMQTFSTSIGRMLILPAFGRVVDGTTDILKAGIEWAEVNEDKLSKMGEDLASAMDRGLTKIRSIFDSTEFQEADLLGKVKIAWNKIITEPFSEWWSSTGKQWFADKARGIGEGIGGGITSGLLFLLGVDGSSAISDGVSIGASFAEGFAEGFDGEKVKEAILNSIKSVFKDAATLLPGGEEASSTSWLSAGGIALALSKLGVFKLLGKGGKGLINLFGKGSKDGMPTGSGSPAGFDTSTMYVSAQVVNLYGNTIQTPGGGGTPTGGYPTGGPPALPGPALPSKGTPPALPGGGGAAAGKALNTVKLKDGVYAVSGGAITTGLAKTGVAMGSGAGTAGGAAAAGASGILGGLLGILGLGAGAVDIYQGTKKTGKDAKDEYWQGGTKIGMVGTGAAAGAAIGSVVPVVGTAVGALAGAGVGGVAALFGGDKAGKALSDATDKDGGLTKFWENTKEAAGNAWDSIKTGASNAGTWVSDKWNEAGDWIGNKWDGFSGWFDESVWTPTKDFGISAVNIAVGAWSEGKDWVSEKWSDFSAWFDESVWTPVTEAAQAAGEWIGDRWDDTKTWISEKWSDFSTWFDESVWTPVSNAAQVAGEWVSERWSEARAWIGERWADFSAWFDESIWEPVKGAAAIAGEWISEKWSEAKTWVSETWADVSQWFDETVWEPVKEAAAVAGEWLGDQFDAAKTWISETWSGVAGWFEEKVWTPIKEGASAAWEWVGDKLGGIGEWVGDKWQSFKGWLGGLGQKGSKQTGLTTSQGKGSIAEHAWGGIMTKPHMGIVAEDGAEGIIPLSPSKRSRGLDLWQRTGEMLGVRPYKDGGIAGEEPKSTPTAVPTGSSGQNITIKVEVKAEPKFTIEGDGDTTDENQILNVLKAYIREMTDDIGDELAERLARIFANMPVKGGGEA